METTQAQNNFETLLDLLRDAEHRLGDLEKIKNELNANYQ